MDLQPLASIDTPALIRQLLAARADASLRHLHALREALDAAVRGIEAPEGAGEDDIQELAATLLTGAQGEIARVQEEAARQLQEARGQIETGLAQNALLEAVLGDAQLERARLDGELRGVREHAEALTRDLAFTADAHAGLEGALREAREELSRAAQERASLSGDLDTAGTLLEQAAARSLELQAEIDSRAVELAALLAQLSALEGVRSERDTLAASLDERHHAVRELEAAQERAHGHVRQLESHLGAAAACEANLKEELSTRDTALQGHLEAARLISEERETLAAALEARAARIDALEAELAASAEHRVQRDDLAVRLEESAERIRTLEAELAASAEHRAQRDELAVRLEESSERIRTLEASLLAGSAAAQEAHEAFTSQLEERDTRLLSLDAEILDLRARLHQTSDAERELRVGLMEALSSGEARGAEAATVRRELDRLVSLFDASASATEEMTGAASSTELLLDMMNRLSSQFSRVALFRVVGDRLKSEGQIGFDDTVDPSALVLPLTLDSMLTRAISAGRIYTLSGEDVALRGVLPFAGEPSSAVALPILLHNTPIAVVYADDWGTPDPARGAAVHEVNVTFARLLLAQAVVLLARHTQELKTLAELREYANTLLDEARVMHGADMDSGKTSEIVRRRLRDSLDCACQLYAYRAAMEGTTAAALLDEQIAEAIREETPFALDLADVAGRMIDSSSLAADVESLITNP